MKVLSIWFIVTIYILSCSITSNAEMEKIEEATQNALETSINDISEIILERFLEAGQLIWLYTKHLIDPSLSSSIQMLLANPFIMTVLILFLVCIPFLLYRSILIHKRRKQELQDLKDAMEDEDFDYEEKFQKIHGKEEITDTWDFFGPENQKELEEKTSGEKVELVELNESQSDDLNTHDKEISQKTIEEEIIASSHSQKIEVSESKNSQENSAEASSPSQAKVNSEVNDEEFIETISQMEQQISTLENEVEETNDFVDKALENAEMTSLANSNQELQRIDKHHNKDSSDLLTDTDPISDNLIEETEKLLDPNQSAVQEDLSGAEVEEELASLQKEMERTIQEISEQLVENDEVQSGVETELKLQTSTNEETLQGFVGTPKDLSTESLKSSDEEISESPSVNEILKWAEGTSINLDESKSIKSEALDFVEENPQDAHTNKLFKTETPSEIIDESHNLSEHLDIELNATSSTKVTNENKSKELSETSLESDLHNKAENFVKDSLETKITAPQNLAEHIDIELDATSSTKLTNENKSKELSETSLESDLHNKVENFVKDSLETKITAPQNLSEHLINNEVLPKKAKDYVNRLEQFQISLENRIKRLENDEPTLTPFERWLEFGEKPITKKATFQDEPDISTSWGYKNNAKTNKKAYSLEVLESFLLLDSQKP